MENDVAMVYQVQNEVLKKYLLTSLKPKMLLIFQTIVQVNIKTRKTCDGTGGTVKRLTKLASLGRATSDQILTPTAMFNFCKYNIEGINLIYLSKDEIDATKAKFAKRFNNIKSIPRTRSFHVFISVTPNEIGVKFYI